MDGASAHDEERLVIDGVDVGGLYGLPLDRFVPERGAMARALRLNGQRGEAAEVASLRKPSVAAWAVNQLVRTQRSALAELFDAGDALRKAQADVLTHTGDGRALRAAAERERATVDALARAARGLLTSEGHELSSTIIDRVTDTLHAAALDDQAREAVREGRLERELRHVGLGVGASAGAGPERPAKTPPKAGKESPAERQRATNRHVARAAESEARRLADRAARALQVAEERRGRAAQALRDAEQAVQSVRAELEAAEDAHRRAKQNLVR